MSVADIQTRVAQIQQRMNIGVTPPVDPFAASAASSSPLAPHAPSFESALAGASSGFGETGGDIIATAKKYLGIPYLWGGTDPAKGLDCSGFVQRVYKDLGVDLPRVSRDQAKSGMPVASLAEAQPGDLVFWDNPTIDHIGIYMGNNQMIVAPKTGDVVKIQTMKEPPDVIRRIIPHAGTAYSHAAFGAAYAAPAMRPLALGKSGAIGPSPYDDLFASAGAKYGIDPKLLSAVAKAESNYNPEARSGAGALGLMQIMPATARGVGVNPLVPSEAVDGAARILSGNLKKFGSVELALAAYNAGGGAVTKYGGIPPYAETQNYVRKITAYLNA